MPCTTPTFVRPALVCLAALLGAQTVAAKSHDTLADFWPTSQGPDKQWSLYTASQPAVPVGAQSAASSAGVRMTVKTHHLDAHVFDLYFSNKAGQLPGHSDVERYDVCNAPGVEHPWLFLRAYLDDDGAGHVKEHAIVASRILFTPEGGKPFDLMENGLYGKCGSTGQPYLLYDARASYRIQVWGALKENPKYKWYWDADVRGAAPVVNECLKPAHPVEAIRVEESWWSAFNNPHGKWGMGSGDVDADGVPTGEHIKHGRTVWHADGQVPYYMTGPVNAVKANWCSH